MLYLSVYLLAQRMLMLFVVRRYEQLAEKFLVVDSVIAIVINLYGALEIDVNAALSDSGQRRMSLNILGMQYGF